jgi:hypothetical protein
MSRSLSPREANVFDCLVDMVIAPPPGLPSLRTVDTAGFLDRYLAASPAPNRAALRGALYALEMGPLALGYRARLRQLGPERRAAYLTALERGRAAPAVQALEAVAKMAYYGDDAVMVALGFDPEAVVARGRELRAREARW